MFLNNLQIEYNNFKDLSVKTTTQLLYKAELVERCRDEIYKDYTIFKEKRRRKIVLVNLKDTVSNGVC